MESTITSHLSQTLSQFLEELEGQDTTIGAFTSLIGDRGFGFILLMLALPAALPLPAPGYATPFGFVMALLGLQMAVKRTEPWLPTFLAKRKIPYTLLKFSVRNARLPLRAVEWVIRPRLHGIARHALLLPGLGGTIFLLSIMMSIPIPLTNTAPSFVIFLIAAGLIEEDGLFLLGGMLLAPIAASIAGTAIYFGWMYGPSAIDESLKPMIKGWLGLL